MTQQTGAVRMALIALVIGLANAVYTTIVMVNAGRHQDNLAKRAREDSQDLTQAIDKLAEALEKQNENDARNRPAESD